MNPRLQPGREISAGLAEFQKDIDRLRRSRLILVASIGAFFMLILEIFHFGLGGQEGDILQMRPKYLHEVALHFHAISFLLAAMVFRIRSLHVQAIQALDFLLFSSNIFLRALATVAITSSGDHFPGIEGILLALVLHGVFVPTGVLFASMLGAFALLSFLAAQTFGYFEISLVAEHWQSLGSPRLFWAMVSLGGFSIVCFAFLGALASKLIHGLSKDAFRANRMGNYIIEREISGGGMGKIYLAKHLTLRRPTALKVMIPDPTHHDEFLSRFEREVELASKLTHPNTISIYDFGRSRDGSFYYAMELLEGENLEDLVRKYGALDPARVIFLLRQICGSLNEAHSRGFIHRDIKPANIFVTKRGEMHDFIKVIDFGLAKPITNGKENATGITSKGDVFGTPAYMPPEAIHGSDQLDQAADIYSLGGVIFWMLTGRKVFEGDISAVVSAHLHEAPQKPSEVAKNPISVELDEIVLRCLSKKKADRFSSVKELLEGIDGVQLKDRWNFETASQWWGEVANKER